jgi:hypothetical protein
VATLVRHTTIITPLLRRRLRPPAASAPVQGYVDRVVAAPMDERHS